MKNFALKREIATVNQKSKRESGFSLIELLSVMTILSLLAVAVVPNLRSTLDGYSITHAADLVDQELQLARQTAISRNVPVEIRFFEHDDGSGRRWRLIATLITSSASGRASDEWLSPGRALPTNIIMDDSSDYSTLLSEAVPVGTRDSGPWTSAESQNAPPILRQKNFVGFVFNPDGSTNLPHNKPWCITMKNLHAKPSETVGPADNFICMVIDPATGRARSFRP